MTLNDLRDKAHNTAKKKGWYDGQKRNIPEQLCLVHSEISEALEEYRVCDPALLAVPYEEDSGKPAGFAVEIADAFIRLFDLAGYVGIDLDRVVALKMAYNEKRPHRHGGKLA